MKLYIVCATMLLCGWLHGETLFQDTFDDVIIKRQPSSSINKRERKTALKSKLAIFPAEMQRYLPKKISPVKISGLAEQVKKAFASGEQYWNAVGPGCFNVPIDVVIRGEKIYLQTDQGVYKSDDGGGHWRNISYVSSGGLNRAPFGMDVSPRNENCIVVSGRGGIYSTFDAGKSWTQAKLSIPDTFGNFRTPRFNCDGSRIFVGVGKHRFWHGETRAETGDFSVKAIFVGDDKANKFKAYILNSNVSGISTIYPHPVNPDVVLFSYKDGEFYITRNARATKLIFEKVAVPEGFAVVGMAIDPAKPDILLATLNAIAGKRMQRVRNTKRQAQFCRFTGILQSKIKCKILPFKTADGRSIKEPSLVSLGINPNNSANIIIGMHYHKKLQMLISNDYGKTFRYWTMPREQFGGNWFECAVREIWFGKNSPISVITSPICVWISRDNLKTLTPLNPYNGKWCGNKGVAGLAHAGSIFLTDKSAYICALDHFLLRSDSKNLQKWEVFTRLTRNGVQVSYDDKYIYILKSNKKVIYASARKLLRFDPSAPGRWLDVTSRLGNEFAAGGRLGGFQPTLKAVFNLDNSDEHWLLVANQIYYTADGGVTFIKTGGDDISKSRISALAYDQKKNIMYLGYGVKATHAYKPLRGVKPLNRSFDKGKTWEPLDIGINNVESIAVAANGNVIIGTALSPAMAGELIVLPDGDPSLKEVKCTIGDTAEELNLNQMCFDSMQVDGNDVIVIANRKHTYAPPYSVFDGALGPLLSTDGGKTFKWIRYNLTGNWIMGTAIKNGLVMIADSGGVVAHKFRDSDFIINKTDLQNRTK